MKKTQYTFEVPDFCPDECKAFSPYRRGLTDEYFCLNRSQCEALHRNMQEIARIDRELDTLLERAAEGGGPYKETEEDEDG